MSIIKTRIINKHETQEDWEKAKNFQPLQGEIIIYDSVNSNTPSQIKIGDGISFINDLPFFTGNNVWQEFTEAPVVESNEKIWSEF